ncbi:MAG: LysM peptidoglycan-binding domain-containing protein [Candidatus Parabeggiatoa sp.]|nr:LysM peptidoglycan-binding domain-containing protein [Candidatus Parabeggiatoa sp.]
MASALAEEVTYTVKRGDTLFNIAKQFYGDGHKWDKIYRINKKIIGNDYNTLEIGQKLRIPMSITYTVKRGDSLSRLAKKFYGGDIRKWYNIYYANQEAIEDFDLIYVGQKLKIPATSKIDFQHIFNVLVNHPEIQRLIRKLKKRRIIKHRNFLRNFRRIIKNPKNRIALAFFGIHDAKKISTQLMRLKAFFIAQTNLNPEKFIFDDDFLKYIHRWLIAPKSVTPPKSFWDKRLENAKAKAERFLQEQQAGYNIVHLILLEKDIFYLPSDSNLIRLYYNGKYYEFRKNKSIVLNIAKTIKRIKPKSKYITGKDPTAGSYNKLIRILR